MLLLLVCSDCFLTEDTKDPDLVCPSKAIGAVKSEDVLLPCHLEPPMDASAETVKWKHGNHVVHHHHGGKHDSSKQWEHFRGRTSLSSEGLTEGNLSLTLSSVDLLDEGRYKCSVHTESMNKMCYIKLNVGDREVVGPDEPVTVEVGQVAVLPCHLEPPSSLSDLTLEWTVNNSKVHIHRSHKDNPSMQDERFRNRTSLFNSELDRGNISLMLKNVTTEDAGNYSCFVPKHSMYSSVKYTLSTNSCISLHLHLIIMCCSYCASLRLISVHIYSSTLKTKVILFSSYSSRMFAFCFSSVQAIC
uniref:Ig-like domain-containing protein n=1 Tax=Poecilia formosa TaxID=48698 RepID=A0A096M7E3_POEFO